MEMQIQKVELTPTLSGWIAARDNLLANAVGMTSIANDEDLETAGRIDAAAKKLVKELESERKKYTSQLDAVKKSIMDEVKALTSKLVAEAERVNKLASAYATEQARKREEELRLIEEMKRKEAEAQMVAAEEDDDPFGEGTAAPQPVLMPATDKVHTTANRFVKELKFEVVNPRAVPREFCSPDEKKIRAYVMTAKANGMSASELSVPGIEFTEVVSMRSK